MKLIDPEKTAQDLVEFIKIAFDKAGFARSVIALSGGVDSSVSFALTIQALGKDNVFPLLLPYGDLNHQGVVDANILIDKYDIDGVLFVPPTVKREIQFMRELERMLRLPVRIISVGKIRTDIAIPQKTLSKLVDRIENARHTIVVEDTGSFRNVLIIDDAVGSGATINETPGKGL